MRNRFFLITAAVLTLFSGMYGFSQYYTALGQDYSALDLFYGTLQLFPLNASFEVGLVPPLLQLARLLAPALTGYAIFLAALALSRRQALLFLASNHVVICGLSALSKTMATEYMRLGKKVVAVIPSESGTAQDFCSANGIALVKGDASLPSVLFRAGVARAERCLIASGDDIQNLAILSSVAESVANRAVDSPLHCAILLTSLHGYTAYFAVSAQMYEGLEVSILDLDMSLAYTVLDRFPLDRVPLRPNDCRQAQLIIVGNSSAAEALLLVAANIGHFANGLLPRISVFDALPEEIQRFYATYPFASHAADIEFIDSCFESPAGQAAFSALCLDARYINTVVFCDQSLSTSLRQALSTPPALRLSDIPMVLCLGDGIQGYGLEKLLESLAANLDIHTVGMAVPNIVMDTPTYKLAKLLHEQYRSSYIAKNSSADSPAILPWERLDIRFKQSSLFQAAHIAAKARAIGCRIPPPDQVPLLEAQMAEATLSDAEVEMLARMEHARWVAERSLAGWSLGKRDNARLLHPDLVPYDELPEATKEFDRDFARMLPSHARLLGSVLLRPTENETDTVAL